MFKLQKLFNVYREGAGDDGDKGGAGGGEGETWRDALPEDIRGNAALQDVNDVATLANNYINTKSMVGNSIRIPGEDASEEARNDFTNKLLESAPGLMIKPDFDNPEQSAEFFRTIGAPAEASGYEIPEIENGFVMPEDRQTMIKEAAHKLGVTKSQFAGVMEVIGKADAEMMAAQKENLDTRMAELKNEWGVTYDERVKAATEIAEKTGAPEALIEAIKSGQAGPEAFKWLHSLSEQMGSEGDNINKQHGDGDSGKVTPAEAQNQIDEIMNNKKHAYWDSTNPGHERAKKHMIELVTMANPGISTDVNDMRAGGMSS